MVSVIGVAVGTMALVVVISVFNGFDEFITAAYNTFDPDLKVKPTEGKVFVTKGNDRFEKVQGLEYVAVFSEVLEENALIRYDDKQYIGRIKGVEENFKQLTGVDSMIVHGEFVLEDEERDWAVIGQGVAYYLSVSLNYMEPLSIFVPKRGSSAMINPQQAFNRNYIFPSGIFGIQQEYDVKYVLVPLHFARDLLDYKDEVTAVELKIEEGYNMETAKKEVKEILGPDFKVLDRNEQHPMLNKVMKSEKLSIFVILTFILIVASFNIIGSLTMLIIDKKDDIVILRSLGANIKVIKRIFFLEGWMISIFGSIIGVITGVLISWMQEKFGIISLNKSGSFLIENYPVHVQGLDVLIIFLTVLAIGFVASYYPVRYITRKYILSDTRESLR